MKDTLHIFFYKFHNFDLLFCVQFDVFSHLNTDDTVRRIKEILSQYSISQRLFGEAVLGLSQVSSLYTVYSVTFSQLRGGCSEALTGKQLVDSVLCNL
jgi:hypothetical protein